MDGAVGARWARLSSHMVALALVLLVALALSERSSGFTTDEGSYAIQAEALRGGSWAIDWPFRTADPDAVHFPYHSGTVTETDEFAYVNHPLWPAALAAVTSAAPEEVGLRLLSMLAVVAAAATAFRLATDLGSGRSAPWAFWLVAASPLLANGLMIWAHAAAAAIAGLASLCIARTIDRRSMGWSVCLVAVLGTGVLLRSEFVLFSIAAALVLSALGAWRREGRLVIVGAACGAATYLALRGEAWWVASIVGDRASEFELTSRAGGSGGWLRGRLDGVAASAFEGAMDSPSAAVVSVLVIVCVALVVANPRRLNLPTVPLLWAAVALTGARLLVGADEPARGIVAAWPLVLLALLAVKDAGSTERCLLALAGLFAVAVFVTQYDDGGGLQWGGRFLSLAIVPVGVAGATGLRALQSRVPRSTAPLVALLAAGGLLGLLVTNQVRSQNASAMATVASTSSQVVVVSNTQIARLDWRRWPERCWLSTEPHQFDDAEAVLDRAGISGAAYVLFDPDVLRRNGLGPRPLRDAESIGTVGSGPTECPDG